MDHAIYSIVITQKIHQKDLNPTRIKLQDCDTRQCHTVPRSGKRQRVKELANHELDLFVRWFPLLKRLSYRRFFQIWARQRLEGPLDLCLTVSHLQLELHSQISARNEAAVLLLHARGHEKAVQVRNECRVTFMIQRSN